MSETYSTDELVEEITVAFEARIESIDDGYTKSGDERLTKMAPTIKELTQRIKSIIIARLRAADALCKAARLAVFEIPAPTPDSLMTFKIDGSMDDLRKAIAEYEGKP